MVIIIDTLRNNSNNAYQRVPSLSCRPFFAGLACNRNLPSESLAEICQDRDGLRYLLNRKGVLLPFTIERWQTDKDAILSPARRRVRKTFPRRRHI